MAFDRTNYDDMVWDRYDEDLESGVRSVAVRRFASILEALAAEKLGSPANFIPPMIVGGYNALYRMRLDGPPEDVMVRVPIPASTKFSDEKTPTEVATTRYIKKNTSIPVPEVFDYGVTRLTDKVNCFIILQHMGTRRDLVDALEVPRASTDDSTILDPNIAEGVLMKLWGQAARYLLCLSRLQFSRIGSLAEHNNSYTIASRPLTMNMQNMVNQANIPVSMLPPPRKTYQTADEWYAALADMTMSQLVFQHNDLVSSRDDCLNKYVSRQLFRKLARGGQLSTFGFAEDTWSAQSKEEKRPRLRAPSATGSFRLWCDDLRPANILLDSSDTIAAFIDWEFAYAAPTQFALDPPWWLLLQKPEVWESGGIEAWKQTYEEKLPIWLKAMEEAEEKEGPRADQLQLGAYMRESWETGRFWLNYAARMSWAFDCIYWKYMDERFFGARARDVAEHELWRTRIHLLSDKEREAMESFVDMKMSEIKQRMIVDWDPEQVRERWQKVSIVDP